MAPHQHAPCKHPQRQNHPTILLFALKSHSYDMLANSIRPDLFIMKIITDAQRLDHPSLRHPEPQIAPLQPPYTPHRDPYIHSYVYRLQFR